jgi:hypothetical protein
MEIRPEVLANSQKVKKFWAGDNEELYPYMPANGEEGDWFERGWCRRCKHDIPIEDNCEILIGFSWGVSPLALYLG